MIFNKMLFYLFSIILVILIRLNTIIILLLMNEFIKTLELSVFVLFLF